MREGKGKWVDQNGSVYEGNYIDILVQAILKKILNMDSENRHTKVEKSMRDNSLKGLGLKANSMTKAITVLM